MSDKTPGMEYLLAVVVTLMAASLVTPAIAKTKYDGMSVEQLEKQLARVVIRGKQMQILARLKLIGEAIDKRGSCRKLMNQAQSTRQRLVELNQRFEKRADYSYRQQADRLRGANRIAVDEYKVCFSNDVKTHHLWRAQSIVDYDSFQKLFTFLAVELEGETEADLNRQADELYAAKERAVTVSKFPVAELAGVAGTVRITRQGRVIRASQGINVLGGDEFRTGQDGRVYIEFIEVYKSARRGPFSLLLGPGTKVRIGRDANMVVQNRAREVIRLALNLEYGSIRVSNIGAGFDSQYEVRSGLSVTDLPGGDAVLSHYPKRALVNVKLRSGSAVLNQPNGEEIRVEPNRQISLRRGLPERAIALKKRHWNAAIKASGDLSQWRRPDVGRRPTVRRPVARQDILLRAASREAVNRMLNALRNVDANGLLAATSGAAYQNARRSISQATLDDVLRRTGRPRSWQTDCVVCQADGSCAVPTVVELTGGPSRGYEALHVVRPAKNGAYYLVNRIDQWDTQAQRRFRNNQPLCEDQIR